MYKEGTNLRSFPPRIKQRVFSASPAVTSKECLAFAPAATANDHRLQSGFGNELRPIRDQLAIYAIDRLQRAFDLSQFEGNPRLVPIVVMAKPIQKHLLDRFVVGHH